MSYTKRYLEDIIDLEAREAGLTEDEAYDIWEEADGDLETFLMLIRDEDSD